MDSQIYGMPDCFAAARFSTNERYELTVKASAATTTASAIDAVIDSMAHARLPVDTATRDEMDRGNAQQHV